MSAALQELTARLARLSDLESAAALASWDQQTKMPLRGGPARASMMATLAEVTHREFTDPEVARLLDRADAELAASAAGEDPDSDEIRLLAVVRRRYAKATRVPSSLAAELARASSEGQEAWVAARERSDFTAFEPHLREGVELTRRYIEYQLGDGGYDCAYDVLLDDYAPGMRTAQVSALFDELSAELRPMIAAIARAPAVDDWPLRARFPEPGQRSLVREVLGMMGFDEAGWRLDDTVHPFALQVGEGDVRLTTRFDERFWPDALYSSMHECGHGLYEAGIPAAYRRGPLANIDSLAQHESQSRLWENMVGRGRPFCQTLAPRMAALAGPEMEGLTPESLYRAVNRVQPSLIRVDSDEATYALHIILRFELEQQLIEGTLDPHDAAEAWRVRFSQLLGIEVHDDADGVLQDVHWAAGIFGYFPTYTLGNLIAAQLWERAGEQLPELDDQLAAGRLGELREWLGLRVHRFGAKYPTAELLEREAGGPMTVAPFIRYLKAKLSDVYGLDLSETAKSYATHERE